MQCTNVEGAHFYWIVSMSGNVIDIIICVNGGLIT